MYLDPLKGWIFEPLIGQHGQLSTCLSLSIQGKNKHHSGRITKCDMDTPNWRRETPLPDNWGSRRRSITARGWWRWPCIPGGFIDCFFNMMVIILLILCLCLHYSLHTKIHCYIINFWSVHSATKYFWNHYLFQSGSKYFSSTLDWGVQIVRSICTLRGSNCFRGVKILHYHSAVHGPGSANTLKHLDRGKLISWQIWIHMCLHVHNHRSCSYW